MFFHAKLIELLKSDPRFADEDGELVLAAVQDAAWKIDLDLVRLLLSENDIKAMLFSEIDDAQFTASKEDKELNTEFYESRP